MPSLYAEESNDSLLSPECDYKVTQISSITLLDNDMTASTQMKITAFECQLNDWSNFYCGTDTGTVIRCTRVQESVVTLPKTYLKSELNSDWAQVSIISFNRSETNKFLVAFSDGIVGYYSIANQKPLLVFTANERPIVDLKWIPNTCDQSFIVLNNDNQILIWDLNGDQMRPAIKFKHCNDRSVFALNLLSLNSNLIQQRIVYELMARIEDFSGKYSQTAIDCN